jgi:hypothetical protein
MTGLRRRNDFKPVRPAAWLLSFVAGRVNVVGLLSFQHQAVIHLTGSTSQLAIAMVSLETWSILHLLALIGSFIAGTVLSGFLIGDSTLKLGRQYGMALRVESVQLLAAVPSLNNGSLSGIFPGLLRQRPSEGDGKYLQRCAYPHFSPYRIVY